MKSFIRQTIACIALAAAMGTVYAEQIKLVSTKDHVTNLDKALEEAKTKIHFNKSLSDTALPAASFLAFPAEVPAAEKMYASLTANPNGSYTINIDATADCQGAKMCMLGTLTMQPQENITVYFDRDNKQVTSLVLLDKGIQGFYTRGFAMADFTPANMQWRKGDVLYTLTWNIEDKNAFVKMANSVIKQLH